LSTAPERALVVGFAVTGQAVARGLIARGCEVAVVDDHPSSEVRAAAESMGVELVEAPDAARLDALVTSVAAVVPSPGLPDRHPVFDAAARAGVDVISEFDLAAAWDDRPVVAITGTDGKTTVTGLVTDMLERSGIRAVAAGNTEVPLVEAIDRPDLDAFVVEASSFRLGHTRRFEPAVATWLNFAEDHLDVHATLGDYEAAKARIWADLDPESAVAVANADDPVVMAHVRPDVRTVTFGGGTAEYHRDGDTLRLPGGDALVAVADLPRALPHDVANSLAAAATAIAAGATVDAVRGTLASVRPLPHRVELVAETDGVAWYDDSKATAPHAAVAAIRSFPSVVLIAGGYNKGLDLARLAEAADHVRAVVAIGDAAAEVAAAFARRRPVVSAATMADAVDAAARLAEPGDAVLLSPGCASFDRYDSYAARGDDFTREVRRRLGGAGA
jgi:UDP-N-acetylmuramoylalanine--D-glutamate ligase